MAMSLWRAAVSAVIGLLTGQGLGQEYQGSEIAAQIDHLCGSRSSSWMAAPGQTCRPTSGAATESGIKLQ